MLAKIEEFGVACTSKARTVPIRERGLCSEGQIPGKRIEPKRPFLDTLVQVPIEKGQKNWQCGGRCFMTPARHLLGGDMQGRHSAIHIGMDDHTRATLTGWLRKQKTPVGLAKRARAMLLLADGYSF